METSKFYTPSVEEFSIGFKYEFQPWDWKNRIYREEWKKATWRIDRSLMRTRDRYILKARIRVKMLDESDIIELGWQPSGESYGGFFIPIDDESSWSLNLYDKLLSISNTRETWFYGKVRNQFELQRVMNMLQIS